MQTTITSLNSCCPQCKHELFGGMLGFGPSVVKCKNCGTLLTTGLTDWQDLSFFEKILNVLQEFIAPSFWQKEAMFLNGVFNIIFVLVVVGLSYRLTEHFLNSGVDVLSIVVRVIVLSCYPVLLVVRIVWLIKQSLLYVKSGEIPRW